MKSVFTFLSAAVFSLAARADLIIVQKVVSGTQDQEMTMKIKDGKSRTDVSSAVSTISDGSGNVVTLMHEPKSFMRISAEVAKSLTTKVGKIDEGVAPKLVPTGKKAKISGFEAEEFTSAFGQVTFHYWIAKTFPNSAAILEQIQKSQSNSIAELTKGTMPGPTDFNGLPVKTEFENGGRKVTVTLVSVKETPVNAAEFNIPAGYTETTIQNYHVISPPTDPAPR